MKTLASSLSHLIASLASSSSLAPTAHHCSHSPAHSFFAFGSSYTCLPTSDPRQPTAHREAQPFRRNPHIVSTAALCARRLGPQPGLPCANVIRNSHLMVQGRQEGPQLSGLHITCNHLQWELLVSTNVVTALTPAGRVKWPFCGDIPFACSFHLNSQGVH